MDQLFYFENLKYQEFHPLKNQKTLKPQLNYLRNGQLNILKRSLSFDHTNLDELSRDFNPQSHHHLLFFTNEFLPYQD